MPLRVSLRAGGGIGQGAHAAVVYSILKLANSEMGELSEKQACTMPTWSEYPPKSVRSMDVISVQASRA